jgi:hypothetical protein
LLDIIAIIHAIMPQRMAEPPEFLDDVRHALIGNTLIKEAGKEKKDLLYSFAWHGVWELFPVM